MIMLKKELKLGKKLGQGGYGAVYEAKNKSGKIVAVKEIKIDQYGIPNIIETSIMTTFKHPNINRATDIFVNKNKLYLVQEKGISDLVTYIEKFKQHDNILKKWFFYLLDAVNTLHKNNIIHGDLKAENILLYDKEEIKITDFSCSVKKWPNKSVFTHVSGTSTHRSPEGILGKDWDESFDVWSLGCTFYQIVYGYPLFRVQEKGPDKKSKLLNAISDWEYFLTNERTIKKQEKILYRKLNLKDEFHRTENQEFNSLLKMMLVIDPKKRSTCQELLALSYFDDCRVKIRYTLRLNRLQPIEGKTVLLVDQILKKYNANNIIISHTIKLFRSCQYLDGPIKTKVLVCFYITLKIFNQDVTKFLNKILPIEELIEWEQHVCRHLSYRLH